ncbi:hypothetical protein [Granulicella arctica]|uniref:hypothetical protein n=1 Tax=Granulicella arctica TaxID=940613 RepID=UPI0021E06925
MNFVISLAKQLGPKGIRLNGVAPGPIYTPLQISGGAQLRSIGGTSEVSIHLPAQASLLSLLPSTFNSLLRMDPTRLATSTVLGRHGSTIVAFFDRLLQQSKPMLLIMILTIGLQLLPIVSTAASSTGLNGSRRRLACPARLLSFLGLFTTKESSPCT